MELSTVREIRLKFETEGERETKAALGAVNDNFDKLQKTAVKTSETLTETGRRTTSVADRYDRLKKSLDPAQAALARMAKQQSVLDSALGHGLLSQGEYSAAMAAVSRQSEAAVIRAAQRAAAEQKLVETARLGVAANDSLARSVGGLKAEFGGLLSVLGTAGLMTVGAGALRQVIEVSKEYEGLKASLATVTGSTGAADAAFSALQSFAATTPYGVAEATKAFITLRSRGLDPTVAALTSYGNMASSMGKSLDQMIEAVADAVTGENERLKEFGITANSMGDKVAYTFRGVTTVVRKNAGEIEHYLQSIGNTNFAGAMDAQSRTLAGAFAALGDSADALAYRVGQGGLADSVNESARALSQLASDGNGVADWMGSYLGGRVSTVTSLFVGLVDQVGKLKAALESLPGGSGILSDFMSGASSGMTAGVGSAAVAGLGNAAYGAASRWWNGDTAQTDSRVSDAFGQFEKAGQAAGDLQARLNDLALKGVPTLQDAINRAAMNPTDTILAASDGRLRQDQAAGLQPDVARQLASAITEATAAGLNPVVTEAFRTFADQAALYANRAGNPNPVARPGSSAHEKGVAVDVSIKGMSADELSAFKEIMEKYGFDQPVANDPVHWLFGGESGTKYLNEQSDAAAKANLAWQDYRNGLAAGTTDINANTAALGGSIAQMEAERIVREAMARAQQDGRALTGDELTDIRQLAAARGEAMNAQATSQFYSQVGRQTDALTASVNTQIAAYGRSAEEVERDRIAREMWAQVQQQGLTVTPQLTAFINQQAEAQAGATTAMDTYARQAQAAQDAMGAFGDVAESILQALRQPADNLAESLGSIATNFADLTASAVLTGEGPLAGILGYSGTNGQQGGILGMLAGNDLAGAFKDATRSGVKLGIGDAIQDGQPMDLTGGLSGQSGGGLMQGLTAGAGAVSSLGAAYVGGQQSGNAVTGGLSGALSGAMGGLALLPLLGTGPVGWIAAGIMTLAGGMTGKPGQSKPDDAALLRTYKEKIAA